MNDTEKPNVKWGARFVSFLLIAGGILGILAAIQMTIHFGHEHRPDRVVVPVISVIVFGWGAIKGIALWRGHPSGYRWAKLLFVLQIPALCVGRLTYEFSTGMSARVLFGHSNRRFGADIGSSLNFLISPEPLGWMLGMNLVAVVVVFYLFRVSRHKVVNDRLGTTPPDNVTG
jgi:hypothetical protein